MTRIASKRILPPPLKASISTPPVSRPSVVAGTRTIPTRVPASWYDYYPASTPDADMLAIVREQDWRTRALADLPDPDELW